FCGDKSAPALLQLGLKLGGVEDFAVKHDRQRAIAIARRQARSAGGSRAADKSEGRSTVPNHSAVIGTAMRNAAEHVLEQRRTAGTLFGAQNPRDPAHFWPPSAACRGSLGRRKSLSKRGRGGTTGTIGTIVTSRLAQMAERAQWHAARRPCGARTN